MAHTSISASQNLQFQQPGEPSAGFPKLFQQLSLVAPQLSSSSQSNFIYFTWILVDLFHSKALEISRRRQFLYMHWFYNLVYRLKERSWWQGHNCCDVLHMQLISEALHLLDSLLPSSLLAKAIAMGRNLTPLETKKESYWREAVKKYTHVWPTSDLTPAALHSTVPHLQHRHKPESQFDSWLNH